MNNNKLLLDINEKPTIGNWIILSLQHLCAMFGATILVPILVNQAAGEVVLTVPLALLTSGIGTILYQICTKSKSPVYLGSSFAFITPMIVAFASAGKAGVFTGLMAVGLLYILIAFIIRFTGTNWLKKLLPPIIVGPMIIIIGLSLAPTAINQLGLNGESLPKIDSIIVILVTFLTTAFAAIKGKKLFKIAPFLFGLIAGYLTSIAFGMVNFGPIMHAKWFSIPNFTIPFVDYAPTFSTLIMILPIALVTISEHVGDHTVLGSIINKDLFKDPGLSRTLLGDGLATFVAGFLGGPANTTYGENTSVIGMSKVASIYVLRLAAIFAIIASCFGKFSEIISSIPTIVLGSISLLLYGFIAVNGLKVLIESKVDFNDNKNVIISSTMLVVGLGGAMLNIQFGNAAFTLSGMTLAEIGRASCRERVLRLL